MGRPEHQIRLRCSALSDQGRVRGNNEDNIYLWGDDTQVLAVVADGMGGAVAGEKASRIAVDSIEARLVKNEDIEPDTYDKMDLDDLAVVLKHAVQEANRNIVDRAVAQPELKGMGTTLTMAFIKGRDVTLAHVGDSRAYLVDKYDQTVMQVTRDHSFVQALLEAGHIREDEVETHPMRNVLYRALGQGRDLDVDIIQNVQMAYHDRLVLCSDGLTLHLSADEIAEIASESDDPAEIARDMIGLANKRGGRDNVSVIIVIAEPVNDVASNGTSAVSSYDGDTIIMPISTHHNNRPEKLPENKAFDTQEIPTLDTSMREGNREGNDSMMG
ncbi:Stp1/IreP family PP2C-type Ser/Thr phosphatase [Phototrophicus methaneseepsis]|uniref:Stp1/IreP family PP2C-type Ser/Thr phosphatase n=1 Tax=Phototrophicus methaneseepsis TaxID=2710758 RepID=A0A7S8E9N2_9CHLR|nr:Stp1/IreP family PP2C-type Ser/Thr phosphatase [Phototrophicus methaneseepsis]QPC82968.1 Stp1/IreP family PP2C-type Ser/Thr phosphatase [Phototrophicus methaneseepsis]